jgi:hypothetical protein
MSHPGRRLFKVTQLETGHAPTLLLLLLLLPVPTLPFQVVETKSDTRGHMVAKGDIF